MTLSVTEILAGALHRQGRGQPGRARPEDPLRRRSHRPVDRTPLLRRTAARHTRPARRPAQHGQAGLLLQLRARGSHDAALTRWLKERLQLAVWPKPAGCKFNLGVIESALLVMLQPPLNLQGIVTPWTAKVKAARAVMAEEARTWSRARAR